MYEKYELANSSTRPMPFEPSITVESHLGPDESRKALEADVLAGLTSDQKSMPPTWFYDDRGSDLFDQITRLPEYYLTRAEREILEAHADEIAARTGADTLVELGSGTSEKTWLLLTALARTGQLRKVVPFDVNEGTLRSAAERIAAAFPDVSVHAVVGDFNRHLDQIPAGGRRLFIFLGSTIGNLDPDQRSRLLTGLAKTMADGDFFLLGTDLVKDADRLVAAYDDAQGVSAEFNRNLFHVLNSTLHADFDVDAFRHLAIWNADEGRMEMRLVPDDAQKIRVADLGLDVVFEAGEPILTEISTKFTSAQVAGELSAAGFTVASQWQDSAGNFQLTLARR